MLSIVNTCTTDPQLTPSLPFRLLNTRLTLLMNFAFSFFNEILRQHYTKVLFSLPLNFLPWCITISPIFFKYVVEDGYLDNSVISDEMPPFLIVKITNGINQTKFVQLKKGVQKESYGDLFETFLPSITVLNYCSTFKWDKIPEKEWKLGHSSICGWNPKDLTSFLPETKI